MFILLYSILFFIKSFFSKCEQVCSLQQIWSHLLNKSLMKNFILCCAKSFYPIQDVGRQKVCSTILSPETSKNVGIGLQNFLNFSFNQFATMLKHFKATISVTPKLLNFQASKKSVFLVKSF